MDEKKTVDMIRLPRQEQYFDREDVFGRDVTSVFPNQGKQEAADAAQSVVTALGAKKFISETELEDIKKTRGGTVEDGIVAADKSLAEQLAENKAKKEAEFQEVWRRMKEGTQRPLDTEEAQFLDGVLQQRAQRERAATEEERQELEAFREALKQRTVASTTGRTGVAGPSTQEEAGKPTTVLHARPAPRPVVRPIIKPVVKAVIKPIRKGEERTSTSGRGDVGGGLGGSPDRKRVGGHDGEPETKRRREEEGPGVDGQARSSAGRESESEGGEEEGAGLAGLLGAYSSGSDDG